VRERLIMIWLLVTVFALHVANGQCIGDYNKDGTVDILDMAFQLDACFQFPNCPNFKIGCLGDLNFDGHVNQGDVQFLKNVWGLCFQQGTIVTGTFPTLTTGIPTTTTTVATIPPSTTSTTTLTFTPPTTTTIQATSSYTTQPNTTAPAGSLQLTFNPSIGSNCQTVMPGAVLVYWSSYSNANASKCMGNPNFIAVGNSLNNYCFQAEYSSEAGYWDDVTFLSCTVDQTAVCAWTSTYNQDASLQQTGINYGCTTGSLNGAPDESYNGQPLPQFQPIPPTVGGNEFAHLTGNVYTQIQAPFQIGNCLFPTSQQLGAPYRSYRAYCNMAQVPQQWKNVPQGIGPFSLN